LPLALTCGILPTKICPLLRSGQCCLVEEAKVSEEFHLFEWLSEGAKGIGGTVRGSRPTLLPESFRQHMRASRKEFLMAFRSLFDSAIEAVDKPRSSARHKATKIKVE
jgi:hypothetical protein